MDVNLTQLAERYSCDKLYNHSYIPKYEQLLAARKHKVRRMLEIGIGFEDLMKPFVPRYVHGASIKMWRDYFPVKSTAIYACDIREDVLINEGDKRIWSFVCDQSKPVDLWKFYDYGWKFDFIIDDGSHDPQHQFLTAAVLVPLLMPGGVYVIEDTYQDTSKMLAEKLGGYVIPGDKRPDDYLVVVER